MKFEKRRSHLWVTVPVILLLVLVRFALHFLKNRDYSGLSPVLPLLMLGFALFLVLGAAAFAAWVWHDSRDRGDDPVLWSMVVLIATPLIGLLLYFLRRSERKTPCPACGHLVSLQANYCERCGTPIPDKEEHAAMAVQKTHHLPLIVAGIAGILLALACLAGFVACVAFGDFMNTDVTSSDRVWNLGTISMNADFYRDGVWDLDFRSASDGVVKEQVLTITDAAAQALHADITCGTVPEGASLTLWLVQGDTVQSYDVTALAEPLVCPLDEFADGALRVRLQIDGVKDTVSHIAIQ